MGRKDEVFIESGGLLVMAATLAELKRHQRSEKQKRERWVQDRIAAAMRDMPFVPDVITELKTPNTEEAKQMTPFQKAVADYCGSPAFGRTGEKVSAESLLLEDPQPKDGEVKVFSRRTMAEMVVNSAGATPGRDEQTRFAALYNRLLREGSTGVAPVVTPDPEAVSEVGLRCPNFKHVTRFIADRAVLARAGQIDFRLPPMLLWGPPGVGKSHFAKLLADSLGVQKRWLSFDSTAVGDQICGSDKHWGNTTHGLVADALLFSGVANPLLVVDELDKARTGSVRGNPMHPLLSALEPVSAKAFRDISLNIDFNASAANWLFLANDLKPIQAPILSRMKVFEIGLPQGDDRVTFAREVAAGAIADMGLKTGFKEPSREVVQALAGLTAREIFQRVQSGVIRAVREMRTGLLPVDVMEGENERS